MGRPSGSSCCARCCAGRRWCRRARVWRSCVPCRTDTCRRHSARRAGSGSTGCCRAGPSGSESWLIVARLIDPAAELATARALDATTAIPPLGATLGLGVVTAKEVYAALDWLGRAQPAIEKALARRHLQDGCLVLYDPTSSYLEGRCCALARFGYSRDGRRDKPQIVIGLLCAADGCPIAVEVFEGDTADPSTLAGQIAKIKDRFGLKRVVLVGDRGLITSASIEEELQPAG